jgi:hypothetical protein
MLLTVDESLAGLGDQAVVFIAALFVVSEGRVDGRAEAGGRAAGLPGDQLDHGDPRGSDDPVVDGPAEDGCGVSERPPLMGVCAAASAAFLTPVATPVNLMVMGPGAYRFGDYWKLGGVLLAWFFIVVMSVVPLVWRF